MEISAHSLSFAKLPKAQSCSPSLWSLYFHSKSSTHHSVTLVSYKTIPIRLQCNSTTRPRKQRNPGAIYASSETTAATDDVERWVLEPVGDGDSKRAGFKVSVPAAFEIVSSVVTVGRLPEKADIVIPVATVSGEHARIEKKDGVLLVTDLDSTNGTFVGGKRLKPGVASPISSGNYIAFGDTKLAIFRVSKLENVKVSSKSEEPEAKENEEPSNTPESTS